MASINPLADALAQGTVPTPNPMALALLGGQNNQQRLQTPQQIAQARLMAQQLSKESLDYSPIGSWTQGAARLADGLVADRQESQANDATAQSAAHARSMWAPAFAGGASPGALTQGQQIGSALADPASSAPPTAGQQLGAALASDGTGGFDIGGLIDQASAKHGIDPAVASRVFQSEGGAGYVGDHGSSFGPFQLHYGGVAGGGNAVAGMGDDFTKATGLDARDPGTVPQQVDYALSQASHNGWGAWHGAQAAGIGNFQGIGGAPQQQASAGPMGSIAGNGAAPVPVGPAPPLMPNGDIPPVGDAPPSSAQAYAPASGSTPPSGAMGAIAAAAGPGAGLAHGVQPQASADPGGAPGPNAGALSQLQLSADGAPPPASGAVPAPNGSNGSPISAPAPRSASGMNPQALMAIMTDPYMPPEQQQMAASMYSTLMTPKPIVNMGDGYGYDPNRGSFIASPGAGHPSVVVEDKNGNKFMVDPYNPNKSPVPIGPQQSGPVIRPATPQERQAAGAAPDAKLQINTKTGELSQIPGAAGDDSYSKELMQGLGKAHAQLASNVEENQAQGRDLNALGGALKALRANGGTTGGLGQQQTVDIMKSINNVANRFNWQPFSEQDLASQDFVSKFNRQLAATAAASGANGGRVTNFSIQNMLKSTPGLELSPTANERLIGIMQQISARNVDVGQQIRDATSDAYGAGQKVAPGDVEKLIRNYDQAHHIMDPITGQDLTKNPTLADMQDGANGPGRNPTPALSNLKAGPAPGQDGVVNVTTPDQARALPPGTKFRTPDGRMMVR